MQKKNLKKNQACIGVFYYKVGFLAETTAEIESMIKARVIDQRFDDVVRKFEEHEIDGNKADYEP